MQYAPVNTPVSIDDLYVAVSRYGLEGSVQLGYFHAIAGSASSPRLFTVNVPVVGDPSDPYGPTYIQGTLDYSTHGLTEAPLLLAFLGNVPANHLPSVDLFNITKDGCSFIARQSPIGAAASQPLKGTLTVIALR